MQNLSPFSRLPGLTSLGTRTESKLHRYIRVFFTGRTYHATLTVQSYHCLNTVVTGDANLPLPQLHRGRGRGRRLTMSFPLTTPLSTQRLLNWVTQTGVFCRSSIWLLDMKGLNRPHTSRKGRRHIPLILKGCSSLPRSKRLCSFFISR